MNDSTASASKTQRPGATRRTLQALALAASLLLAPSVARAGPGVAPTGQATSTVRTEADPFEQLGRLEDEGLATHRAAHHDHWSTGEIVLVVVLLIICFPLGLIVLIVILLSHDD